MDAMGEGSAARNSMNAPKKGCEEPLFRCHALEKSVQDLNLCCCWLVFGCVVVANVTWGKIEITMSYGEFSLTFAFLDNNDDANPSMF